MLRLPSLLLHGDWLKPAAVESAFATGRGAIVARDGADLACCAYRATPSSAARLFQMAAASPARGSDMLNETKAGGGDVPAG